MRFGTRKSSKVSVSLNYDEPTAILFIRDNGLGNRSRASVKAPLPGHFGLLGMRERITAHWGRTRNLQYPR